MNNAKQRHLSLNVAAVMDFLPAVTQCVETASLFFGLGKNESLKLQLASEEIFSYLCERVCRGNPVEILCRGGLFYARVEFHFTVPTLDMGALAAGHVTITPLSLNLTHYPTMNDWGKLFK